MTWVRRAVASSLAALALTVGAVAPADASVIRHSTHYFSTSTKSECLYAVGGRVVDFYHDEFGRFWWLCYKP